jgi:acyl carrier protein
MGLDGVELVMAVEEEFKIAISDSDAEQCVTVGRLVDLVHARLRHTAQEPCPSQHGFYIVRRQLMNVLGVTRAQIKPETRLDDLIGKKNRRERWRDLVESLTDKQTRWPALVRPTAINVVVFGVLPAATCIGLAVFTWLPFPLAFFAAVAVGFIGACLTVPFKCEFPHSFCHVQDMIKFTKTLDSRIWSKEEVFQKVRAITVEQLGVKESQVTLEARFVDDLGVG